MSRGGRGHTQINKSGHLDCSNATIPPIQNALKPCLCGAGALAPQVSTGIGEAKASSRGSQPWEGSGSGPLPIISSPPHGHHSERHENISEGGAHVSGWSPSGQPAEYKGSFPSPREPCMSFHLEGILANRGLNAEDEF